jgi:hypothetical protein
MDARPSLDVAFAAFGVAATIALPGDGVLLPDEPAQAITAVWLPAPSSALPPGIEVNAVEPRNRLAFRRQDVSDLKRGSIILVPEVPRGPVKRWRVDVIDESSAEEVRVLVLPVEPEFP